MEPNKILPLFIIIINFALLNCYTFESSIDNLLHVANTSTLYAISSSHLHQLHWSSVNHTLLLLHRRVQLHSSLDNIEKGVSVFLYEQSKNLLLVCSRSAVGRCILYDANDISRVYQLDSSVETNYLGCQSGCFTFLSSSVIRSALVGNRHDKNGNIVNSLIELKKDLFNYNINYQFKSSDHTLITSLTFLPDKLPDMEYIYGFDYQQYTYYVLKSSRIARLCQSSIAMRMTYEEISLITCRNQSSNIAAAFHFSQNSEYLYLIYENTVCIHSMDDILRAFKSSKIQCRMGHGYRLEYIVDTEEAKPRCEKNVEHSLMPVNECAWLSYRTNTYMNGTIGAVGEIFYQTAYPNVMIRFIYAEDNIVVIATSQRRVLKFIRQRDNTLNLLHESIYHTDPFNGQYVVDNRRQSLIFAVGTELHQYAYNSCLLYDTCRSCIGSRRYDNKPCTWFDGKCSFSSDPTINDRGCPPIIYQIQPMNASVNAERVTLTISGSFDGAQPYTVHVLARFSLSYLHEAICVIDTVQNDNIICNLILPKEPCEGVISVRIKPDKALAMGDTDITGLVQYSEKFQVYIPKPILVPNYGPAIGGTKIQVQNLNFNMYSTIKIFLGKKECPILNYDYTTDEVECISQACDNDEQRLELSVQVNERFWQLNKTYFQCRANPIIFNWYPKRSIMSGGLKFNVSGRNLDAVQKPTMKFLHNSSILNIVSFCEAMSTSQMTCLSPMIDTSVNLTAPFDLNVLFVMDNMKIVPINNTLNIVDDPVYYPFEDLLQDLTATNIIRFEGINLASTHSIDNIDVRIDNVTNACLPFNFTNTELLCLLSKSIARTIQNSEPIVEVRVGRNLSFSMGKLLLQNTSPSSLMTAPHTARQFGPWTILMLLIISSVTILTLLFSLVTLTRRRFNYDSEQYRKETKPPKQFQTVWCALGKNKQVNRKNLTMHEKIGQGCFGDVYRGDLKRKGNKPVEVAVKVLRDQSVGSMNEFIFEANRMKDFSHANILSLIGVAWDPSRKAMVLLPFMKNGDLRSYIINDKNRPTVRQLMTWAIHVADGMEYLASLKFVHRDLATRNCMLDEQLICRISDFGLSRDVLDRDYYIVPLTTSTDHNGKPIQVTPRRLPIRWLSPESIETSKYTIQSDVWSFGVLLWELMNRGKTPYPGIDNADIYTYVKHGYRLQQPKFCPTLLYKTVMSICWHADPAQRPSFTQIAHDIRHILHQLEVEQQQEQQRKQSTSGDEEEDTTIVQRYPVDRKIKHLSSESLSSNGSIGGQYITTPHRQSENTDFFSIRREDNEDAYTVMIHETTEVFSTTRLLPRYTETSLAEDA